MFWEDGEAEKEEKKEKKGKKNYVRGDSCEAPDETDFLKRSVRVRVRASDVCNLLRCVSDVVCFHLHNADVIQMCI